MAKPNTDTIRFFREHTDAEVIAAAVLGLAGATREAAARALAQLCADRARLVDLLAALPGAALIALEVIARARHPLDPRDIVKRLDADLGAGRGEAALAALRGRGFLGTTGGRYLQLWPPLVTPILAALEGADLVPLPVPAQAGADAPAEAPPPTAPDRGGFAVALLLGELSRRRPRITNQSALYKRDLDDLETRFAGALGNGAVELFVIAFTRLGLASYEDGAPGVRGGLRLVIEDEAARRFLAQPRGERIAAFARVQIPPAWLAPALRARGGLVPRAALARAERNARAWDGDASGIDRWLGYAVAAGVLEEVSAGFRAAPELRGEARPAPPSSGRWLVQPNLELVVPPDVPVVDAYLLAAVAEVAALDRAAVLRLTPGSLAAAADAGLDADGVMALLSHRAAVPLPDLAVRAVRDGVRGRPAARSYEGVVVTVPPAALPALRARRDLDELVQAEIAPGVFLLQARAEARFAKAVAAAGAEVRRAGEARRYRSSHDWSGYAAKELERILAAPPLEPADPRLAAALARARAGDPGEFAAPASAVGTAPGPAGPSSAAVEEAEALMDALLEGLDRRQGHLPVGVLPPRQHEAFIASLEDVFEGRRSAAEAGPAFLVALRAVVTALRLPRAAAPRGSPAPVAPEQPPMLSLAWQEVAAAAIAARRNVWLKLGDEGRPRLVTPHRLLERGGAPVLEALAHDSGDLRAFDGARIQAAAAAGPADPALLAGAGAAPALRAARNDRCPCGSGRKYKACCLPKDLEGSTGR